jgi:FMN reductase
MLDAGAALAGAFSRADLSPGARSIVDRIENADALIISVPVYKGSYPGLFKHLIDFLEPKALLEKPVIIGATGRALQHALVVEHQLRPLFAFFSAWTVPTAVYATDADFEGGELRNAGVCARIRQASSQFQRLLLERPPRRTETVRT